MDQQLRAIQLLLSYGYGPPRAEMDGSDGRVVIEVPMPKEIKLQLPLPHPAQRQVIQQAKRFNVVCCGRRWGRQCWEWTG